MTLNPHTVGLVMREACDRTRTFINARRFSFTARLKGVRPDGRNDWVTDVDEGAEKICIRILREHFPGVGIVSEESALVIPPDPGVNAYFTVDPLDGTSAFKERRPTGVAVMIALVEGYEITAVCICDVFTGEQYYYRPDSQKTHRLMRDKQAQPLTPNLEEALCDQYLLLRDQPRRISSLVTQIAEGDLFKNFHITSGSIGLSTAQLWTGAVGATITHSAKQTPWDVTPVVGISRRLGFRFFQLQDAVGKTPACICEFNPVPSTQTIHSPTPVMMIHRSNMTEFINWAQHCHIKTSVLSPS